MKYGHLPGLDKDVSRLILGCDNKMNTEDGAPVWDAFLEAGGTAFDTAFVYGAGRCEEALGGWIKQRGVADGIAVVVKGAHTPFCDPDDLVWQLQSSLERLTIPAADIYIMHRDNLEVPVSEFIDVLDAEAESGMIKCFGASNWTMERFQAANDYAAANDKRGFCVLNNNLSLAHMVKPVWPGCVSSSEPAALAYLAETNTSHFSWSSQARGYFFAAADASQLPEGTEPEACFDSPDNRVRRRRAQELAADLGVGAGHIATAYVLNQPFPSYAVIGPRTVAQLEDTLAAADLALTPEQLAWLDLRSDEKP